MKALSAAIILLSAAPAIADGKECFYFVDNPNWVVTVGDPASEYGLRWVKEGAVTELSSGSAGTGISTRVATDDAGEMHPYIFVGEEHLVIDMQLYKRDACKD